VLFDFRNANSLSGVNLENNAISAVLNSRAAELGQFSHPNGGIQRQLKGALKLLSVMLTAKIQ